MKKLAAFFILFLLVLAGTTYYYYIYWHSGQRTKGTAWSYIPKNAAVVYEIAALGKQWTRFQQFPIIKTLCQQTSFTAIHQGFQLLNDLVETPRNLQEVPLLVSVHEIGEAQLGYVLYFNTEDLATKVLLDKMLTKVNQDGTYSKTVRKYAGHKIVELRKQGTSLTLSYIKLNQHVIVSYAALLIEDVVRELAAHPKGRLQYFTKASTPHGSLFFNFNELPQLLRIFFNRDQVDRYSTIVTRFTRVNHFNLNLTPHHVLLSGLDNESVPGPSYFTHTLAAQTARSLLLTSYLPQSTAMLQHFTFSDAEQFYIAWQKYRLQLQTDTLSQETESEVLANTLHSLLRGEIGLCSLATVHNIPKEQLVFMKVQHTQTFIEALKGLGLLISAPLQAPHPHARAYQLSHDHAQHWLLDYLFPNFECNYVTQIDDYIVFANSQRSLQTWYGQYAQGHTWLNDAQQATRLASRLDHAQFSLLVDLSKVWQQVLPALKPTWQKAFKTYAATALQQLYISLQVVQNPDTGCHINIVLNDNEQNQSGKEQAQREAKSEQRNAIALRNSVPIFETEASIIHHPWLLASHRSKGHYILLQDALYQLYFLDPSGKLLWKKPLEGPIITDLFTIDYYKNGKKQYLFATDSRLHLIDYYGHRIGKYPHRLRHPRQLNVVDYNRTQNYRFLIATTEGNIYLKDKYCQSLSGWSPKALKKDFASMPVHLRVQGKDYLLALQTNGTLQALNRQGVNYPGFPVELKAVVHNPLLVRKGKTASDTILIVLTDRGQHICLNLHGHIQEVVQLDVAKDTSRFTLCPDHVGGNHYVVMRQDADQVTVLDEANHVRFSVPHQARNLLLQYYNFGGSRQFYVLVNTDQQLTYIYDHEGKPCHDAPWHNRHKVKLLFSEAEKCIKLYAVSGKKLIRSILTP